MRALFAAFGLSVLATSALATPAVAADLPLKAPAPPPVQAVSWTGLYVGGHAGYAWGRSDGDLTFDPDRRQAAEPVGYAAVERRNRVHLAVAVLDRLDFHTGMVRPACVETVPR